MAADNRQFGTMADVTPQTMPCEGEQDNSPSGLTKMKKI